MLEEIWDAICDGFAYIISFEWLGDLWEFMCSLFENIAEFSIMGLILGAIGAGTVFLAKEYMLNPFMVHMGRGESIFWTVATYAGTFIAGYLLGKHFDNT